MKRSAVRSDVLGVPSDLFLWLGVVVLVSFVLSWTTFGRRIYATGNNSRAAFLAGIDVRIVTVALYMLSGLFAALAGIVLVGYSGQAALGMGDPYLFQSITAVVIGGTSLFGGAGTMVGTIAGSIMLGALANILQLNNIRAALQLLATGAIIVLAAVLQAVVGRRDGSARCLPITTREPEACPSSAC